MRLGKALAVGVAEASQEDEAPVEQHDTEAARQDAPAAASDVPVPAPSDADQQAATPPAR